MIATRHFDLHLLGISRNKYFLIAPHPHEHCSYPQDTSNRLQHGIIRMAFAFVFVKLPSIDVDFCKDTAQQYGTPKGSLRIFCRLKN